MIPIRVPDFILAADAVTIVTRGAGRLDAGSGPPYLPLHLLT